MFDKLSHIEMMRRQMPGWSEDKIQKDADFMEKKYSYIKTGKNVMDIRHLGQLVSKEELKTIEDQLKLIQYELSSFDEGGIVKNSFDSLQSEVILILNPSTIDAIMLGLATNVIWDTIKITATYLWSKVHSKSYITYESGGTITEKRGSFSLKLIIGIDTTLEFNLNNVNEGEAERCLDKALDYVRQVKNETELKSHDVMLFNNENKAWEKVVFTPELLRAPSGKVIRKLTLDEYIEEINIKNTCANFGVMKNPVTTFGDIATINKNKVGRVLNITFPSNKKISMYDQIKLMGYGYTSFMEKRIFILRDSSGIKKCSFLEIKQAFINYLKTLDLIDNTIYLNAFYKKNPLKPNYILRQVLNTDLSMDELHKLLYEHDSLYKRKFMSKKVKNTLIDEWGFTKIPDLTNSGYNYIYYIKIQKSTALMFSSFYDKKAKTDIYDCSINEYKNIKDIGRKNPEKEKGICHDFKIEPAYLGFVKSYIKM